MWCSRLHTAGAPGGWCKVEMGGHTQTHTSAAGKQVDEARCRNHPDLTTPMACTSRQQERGPSGAGCRTRTARQQPITQRSVERRGDVHEGAPHSGHPSDAQTPSQRVSPSKGRHGSRMGCHEPALSKYEGRPGSERRSGSRSAALAPCRAPAGEGGQLRHTHGLTHRLGRLGGQGQAMNSTAAPPWRAPLACAACRRRGRRQRAAAPSHRCRTPSRWPPAATSSRPSRP